MTRPLEHTEWLRIWAGAYEGRRMGDARRLLQVRAAGVAEWLRDTSEAPAADWRSLHELLGLQVPRMPRPRQRN